MNKVFKFISSMILIFLICISSTLNVFAGVDWNADGGVSVDPSEGNYGIFTVSSINCHLDWHAYDFEDEWDQIRGS